MLMLYFSGTGNSRYIANMFSKNMGAKCVSIEASEDFKNLIKTNDTIGFCYPIYGGCVPRIMRDFVATHLENLKNKNIIIFCTQLMFSGDGARAFSALLPKGHCNIIYAEHFNMPNNICNVDIFKIKNGADTEETLKKAQLKMEKVCNNIKAGIVVKRGFNPISYVLGKSQSAFWPSIEDKNKSSVKIHKDCVKCGLCVEKCPVNNLTLKEDGIKQNNGCIICYRCVNSCPQKAITVLVHKKPKTQYKGVN